MKWLLNNIGLENLTDIKFSMAKFGSISVSIGGHNSPFYVKVLHNTDKLVKQLPSALMKHEMWD